ncbi:hypothetical protein LTR08_003611 [Meristemomyces frigidus]|nr:hypothetical protein LTR08_003611 [Meristemomyces frigidus]
MRATTLGLTFVPFALHAAAEDCSCGYSVNSTNATYFGLFTQKIENDFVHSASDVTWDSTPGPDWQAQEYNVPPPEARGLYGKAAQPRNVNFNVLPPGSTGGNGTLGGDPGLQLWTRSELVSESDGQYIPMAEIVTAQKDILYGSFRVGMKTTAINGTCGAWFFYHNNSQEIDMEVLSKDRSTKMGWPVNLVNQSPQSVASGYNARNTSGFLDWYLTIDPKVLYTEFRMDWLPDRIDWYANGQLLATFRDNIPTAAGALHLIHWSNGDPFWSGGPPEEDAVLTVAYVNAYFNTTSQAPQSAACGPGQLTEENTCNIISATSPPQQPNVAHPGSAPEPLRPSNSAATVSRARVWFTCGGIFGGTIVLTLLGCSFF